MWLEWEGCRGLLEEGDEGKNQEIPPYQRCQYLHSLPRDRSLRREERDQVEQNEKRKDLIKR